MGFKILNAEEPPKDQWIPHHTDMWYDRHEKMWIVELMDIYNNRINEIERRYSKADAIKMKEEWEKEYNL